MIFSFYRLDTGEIIGRRFSGSDLEANTPQGCGAIAGSFDRLSQRVDLDTGQVVDYQPPQPDADHEWNAERRRWVKRPAVLLRERRREAALAEIARVEIAQARAVREILLAVLPDGPEKTRLQQIEDQIAARRSDLTP